MYHVRMQQRKKRTVNNILILTSMWVYLTAGAMLFPMSISMIPGVQAGKSLVCNELYKKGSSLKYACRPSSPGTKFFFPKISEVRTVLNEVKAGNTSLTWHYPDLQPFTFPVKSIGDVETALLISPDPACGIVQEKRFQPQTFCDQVEISMNPYGAKKAVVISRYAEKNNILHLYTVNIFSGQEILFAKINLRTKELYLFENKVEEYFSGKMQHHKTVPLAHKLVTWQKLAVYGEKRFPDEFIPVYIAPYLHEKPARISTKLIQHSKFTNFMAIDAGVNRRFIWIGTRLGSGYILPHGWLDPFSGEINENITDQDLKSANEQYIQLNSSSYKITNNRYKVTASLLKVRRTPYLNGYVLTTIAKDLIVEKIANTKNVQTIDGITAPWVRIRLSSGMVGYVFGGYLTKAR